VLSRLGVCGHLGRRRGGRCRLLKLAGRLMAGLPLGLGLGRGSARPARASPEQLLGVLVCRRHTLRVRCTPPTSGSSDRPPPRTPALAEGALHHVSELLAPDGCQGSLACEELRSLAEDPHLYVLRARLRAAAGAVAVATIPDALLVFVQSWQ